ncbi:MAG: hemerythrin domain-containing protein [Rhodospirillaceae bacterium]
MRNEVLERLTGDHARFERFFRAIEEQCARLDAGKPADVPRLKAIVSYLAKFAFPRHHALEDAIFAQLVKRMPNFWVEIFDLPEDHHTSKQEFMNFMLAVERGDDDLADTARSFVANERGHFISEEEIVFRYARKHLTADQWAELREGLRIIESEDGHPQNVDLIADLLA